MPALQGSVAIRRDELRNEQGTNVGCDGDEGAGLACGGGGVAGGGGRSALVL